MKRVMCFMTLGILAFGMSVSFAGQAPVQTNDGISSSVPKTKQSKGMPSAQFGVSASIGTLKMTGKGVYVLEAKLANINQVTLFTGRPYKIISHVGADELQKLWDAGSNSFKSDPPNASLTVAGRPPFFVTIIENTIKAGSVFYTLKPLSGAGEALPLGQVSSLFLVIDADRLGKELWCCPAGFPDKCCTTLDTNPPCPYCPEPKA
jgi:hypothetical protein